jgi:hypothetical protein
MRMISKTLLYALALVSSSVPGGDSSAVTAGDLQKICTGSSAGSKAACRFYILGISQGVTLGMSIADGKTKGGRPCIPDNTPSQALELAVKMKLGQDLMVYPEDKKLDASGVIGAILVDTFPCRNTR